MGYRSANGVDLRVFEVPTAAPECPPDQPCLPPACVGTGLHVAVSNREAVATLGAHVIGRPAPEEVWLLTWSTFGVLEGGPATVAVVLPGDGIERVRLEGERDDEVAVDGEVVALAVPGASARRVVGLRGDAEYDPTPFDATAVPDGMGDSEGCALQPPTLPEEHDPPADRAAAEAAVREVVTHVFTAEGEGGSRKDILEFVEGGDDLTHVQEQVQERYGDQDVSIAIELSDELTFQGPDHAAFRFTLTYNGSALLTDHVGRAVFEDGRWKVDRSMWCSMISRGGIQC